MTMLDFLHIAAKEARDELLQQQLNRPKRISKEVPTKKRLFENGPNPFSLHLSNVRNEERAHKKMRFDRNFSDKQLECRPTDGMVIGEPSSCNNTFTDFPGEKEPENANDKAKKPEKRRKPTKDCNFGNVEKLPEDVRKKIEEKARLGGEDDLKIVLVIQKVLERSDVLRQQNRVTIPFGQIQNKFLTPQQEEELEKKIGTHYVYMTVPIIEPSGRVRQVQMRRWNVGRQSISYVLNGDWKHVVEFNQLQEDQTMQLWAFWIQGMLNFAFVILPGGGGPVSTALAVISDHHPQTGCLITGRFDEASTSRPQPNMAAVAEIDVEDEVGGSSHSGSEAENSRSRSEDSAHTEPRWRFDLNMEPELE